MDVLDLAIPSANPPKITATEADMIELLRQKYTRIRRGTTADRYVRAAHVGIPNGYGMAQRIADYIVADTYAPQHIIGFEVKVSRSDWLHELKQPDKAEAWRKYCHRWYLVVPDVSIVRDDLPDGWGLMCGNTKLRQARRSAVTEAAPMPTDVLAWYARSVAKTARGETP